MTRPPLHLGTEEVAAQKRVTDARIAASASASTTIPHHRHDHRYCCTRPMRICAYCLKPNHWHFIPWSMNDGDLAALRSN
jgi:hypothetical protein